MEQAGIATAAIFVRSFRHVAEQMGVPRTVITRNPMGRPLGAPGDVERQRAAFDAAMELLESAQSGGAVEELEDPYRPGRL